MRAHNAEDSRSPLQVDPDGAQSGAEYTIPEPLAVSQEEESYSSTPFDMNEYLTEPFTTASPPLPSFSGLFSAEGNFGFVEDDYLFHYDPISFIRNLQPVLEDESESVRRQMVLSYPEPMLLNDPTLQISSTYFNLTSSLDFESLPKLLDALPSSDRLRQSLSTIDLHSLNMWLSTYWSSFHVQLPLLHQSTFYPQLENQGLLLIMLAIGEASMSTPSRSLAWVSIALRSKILLEDFGPNLSLETLQCLVLSCFFDLFLSNDSNAQFSAECFIATLVSYARRTSAMVKQEKALHLRSADAGQVDGMEWMQWIGEEMKTRAAYAVIALDSFLPLLRGQLPSRRYTIFAVQLPLPADDVEWNARSAAEWSAIVQAKQGRPGRSASNSDEEVQPDESFHPALNPNYEPTTTQPGLSTEVKKCLGAHTNQTRHDAWSCFLLLMSVSTIVWDSQRAEPFGSLHSATGQSVRASVHVSCQALVNSAEANGALSRRCLEDLLFLVDIRVFADVVALQIVSNRAVIGGGKPSARHFQAALHNIKHWTTSEEAELAVALSARYVEKHLLPPAVASNVHFDQASAIAPLPSQPKSDTSLLTPWAIYCAAICLYCFQTVSASRSPYAHAQIEDMLLRCQMELQRLHCADAVEGAKCLQDMLAQYRRSQAQDAPP